MLKGGLWRIGTPSSQGMLGHEGLSSSNGARRKSTRFSPPQGNTMGHVRGVERRGEVGVHCENGRCIASYGGGTEWTHILSGWGIWTPTETHWGGPNST